MNNFKNKPRNIAKQLTMILMMLGVSACLLLAGATTATAATAEKIVFTSTAIGGGNEIFIMNSDGTNQTRLTNHPGGG